jgi:hypothetical protein
MILRHWAGVLPATRILLGRGPTGVDTTNPLIAKENDEDLQLIPDLRLQGVSELLGQAHARESDV